LLVAGVSPSAAQNPPPLIVPQVTPQFNDPGPQLTIPQPGNPVQQLAPTSGIGPQVIVVPQIQAEPEEAPPRVIRHGRHHGARHPQASRGHVSAPKHTEPPQHGRGADSITSSANRGDAFGSVLLRFTPRAAVPR